MLVPCTSVPPRLQHKKNLDELIFSTKPELGAFHKKLEWAQSSHFISKPNTPLKIRNEYML
jgi:hypothetical protein